MQPTVWLPSERRLQKNRTEKMEEQVPEKGAKREGLSTTRLEGEGGGEGRAEIGEAQTEHAKRPNQGQTTAYCGRGDDQGCSGAERGRHESYNTDSYTQMLLVAPPPIPDALAELKNSTLF